MISSCSAGYTVHCMQLVIHVIEQPRRFWCYFPFVSHESCWMSRSQSSGEMPGSWPFVTSLPLINLVKCNLTKLTTTSLAVKRSTSLAVKQFISLVVKRFASLAVKRSTSLAVHKLSSQAVHKLSGPAAHKRSGHPAGNPISAGSPGLW